jgi:hypothetical protein
MPRRVTIEDVRLMLEDATQSLPGSIGPHCEIQALDGWDSMGMVMFMGLVHDQCGLELSVHDLRECETLEQLVHLITERRDP